MKRRSFLKGSAVAAGVVGVASAKTAKAEVPKSEEVSSGVRYEAVIQKLDKGCSVSLFAIPEPGASVKQLMGPLAQEARRIRDLLADVLHEIESTAPGVDPSFARHKGRMLLNHNSETVWIEAAVLSLPGKEEAETVLSLALGFFEDHPNWIVKIKEPNQV